MSILSNLGNIDLKRLAQEIVQDTANDLKDEVNVSKMLSLLKEGNSPADIAKQMGEDLNVVEKLKEQAVKNVKEELGMDTTTTSSSSSTSSSTSTSSSSGNTVKRSDIKISEMPMSGKKADIKYDDE